MHGRLVLKWQSFILRCFSSQDWSFFYYSFYVRFIRFTFIDTSHTSWYRFSHLQLRNASLWGEPLIVPSHVMYFPKIRRSTACKAGKYASGLFCPSWLFLCFNSKVWRKREKLLPFIPSFSNEHLNFVLWKLWKTQTVGFCTSTTSFSLTVEKEALWIFLPADQLQRKKMDCARIN